MTTDDGMRDFTRRLFNGTDEDPPAESPDDPQTPTDDFKSYVAALFARAHAD